MPSPPSSNRQSNLAAHPFNATDASNSAPPCLPLSAPILPQPPGPDARNGWRGGLVNTASHAQVKSTHATSSRNRQINRYPRDSHPRHGMGPRKGNGDGHYGPTVRQVPDLQMEVDPLPLRALPAPHRPVQDRVLEPPLLRVCPFRAPQMRHRALRAVTARRPLRIAYPPPRPPTGRPRTPQDARKRRRDHLHLPPPPLFAGLPRNPRGMATCHQPTPRNRRGGTGRRLRPRMRLSRLLPGIPPLRIRHYPRIHRRPRRLPRPVRHDRRRRICHQWQRSQMKPKVRCTDCATFNCECCSCRLTSRAVTPDSPRNCKLFSRKPKQQGIPPCSEN